MSGNPSPWDFPQAQEASREAQRLQIQAEQVYTAANDDLAAKERSYKVALAQEITRLHADGTAWTTAEELARGSSHIADLRYARDLAKGVMKGAESSLWRHAGNRKDTLAFIEWSRSVAPLGEFDKHTMRAA